MGGWMRCPRGQPLRLRDRSVEKKTKGKVAMTTNAKADTSGKYHEEEIEEIEEMEEISEGSVEHSNSRSELDRRLDQALEETFPASDPISIVISMPGRRS
jgi:hypothetical protein